MLDLLREPLLYVLGSFEQRLHPCLHFEHGMSNPFLPVAKVVVVRLVSQLVLVRRDCHP